MKRGKYCRQIPCFFLLSGMQELTDDYGDLDDSALDVEGPAALVYRFSRRKSDTKSDENSQSSKFKINR